MSTLEPELIIVDNNVDEISCDGGGGALGHPRIFGSFDGQDITECGYCDRVFAKKRSKNKVKAYLRSA